MDSDSASAPFDTKNGARERERESGGHARKKKKTIAQTNGRGESSFLPLALALPPFSLSQSVLTDESTLRVASVEPPLDLMMTEGILGVETKRIRSKKKREKKRERECSIAPLHSFFHADDPDPHR